MMLFKKYLEMHFASNEVAIRSNSDDDVTNHEASLLSL